MTIEEAKKEMGAKIIEDEKVMGDLKVALTKAWLHTAEYDEYGDLNKMCFDMIKALDGTAAPDWDTLLEMCAPDAEPDREALENEPTIKKVTPKKCDADDEWSRESLKKFFEDYTKQLDYLEYPVTSVLSHVDDKLKRCPYFHAER